MSDAVTLAPHPSDSVHALTVHVLGADVPALSLAIGLGAVVLTRLIITDKEVSRGWDRLSISLMLLTSLGLFAFIIDHDLGPGGSFGAGVGFAASGMGVIKIARARFVDVMRALLGKIPDDKDPPDPSSGGATA